MSNVCKAAFVGVLAGALCVPVLVMAPAQAQGGHPGVKASGSCDGGGTWKLKAKGDDPSIVAIEFEVDTNKVGQVWHVVVTDNTKPVISRNFTTAGASGSFTAQPRTADQAGPDTIHVHATFKARVCDASVTL